MIPFNLFLLGGAVILGVDSYELFFPHSGPIQFSVEFTQTVLTDGIPLFFVLYAMGQDRALRSARWLFLVLCLLDTADSIYYGFHWNGTTHEQLEAMMEKWNFWECYWYYLLPSLLGCSVVLLLGISFQIKKPYFYTSPPVSGGQAFVLRVMAMGFYLLTFIVLVLNALFVAARMRHS